MQSCNIFMVEQKERIDYSLQPTWAMCFPQHYFRTYALEMPMVTLIRVKRLQYPATGRIVFVTPTFVYMAIVSILSLAYPCGLIALLVFAPF